MIKNSKYSFYYICAAVFLLTFVIRVLYLLKVSNLNVFLSPGGDAQIYQDWADAIISGNSITQPYFRAPLYPNLIALLASLFNNDTFWPIRIFQIIISSFTSVLLTISASFIFGRKTAYLAGLSWAVYGMSIYFDAEGLITSLYTSLFVFMIFLLLLFQRIEEKRSKKFIFINLSLILLISITLAALTALRANALLWWPVILIAVFMFSLDKSKLHALSNTFLTLIIAYLLIQPILKHNYRYDGGVRISTQGGVNLFLGNHKGASGLYADDPDFGNDWIVDQIIYRAENSEGKKLKFKEVDDYYRDQALEYIKSNPLDFLKLTAKRLLFVFNGREIGNNRALQPYLKNVNSVYSLITSLQYGLLLVIVFPVSVQIWKKYKGIRIPVLLAAVHILSIIFFFINARYRFPIVPVLILLFVGAVKVQFNKNVLKEINWKKEGKTILAFFLVLIVVSIPVTGEKNKNLEGSWYFHQGNASLRLKEWNTAKAAFRKLINLDPTFKNANLNLGVCYLNSDQLDSADYYFTAEIQQNPGNASGYNNLGVVFEKQDNYWEAISQYKKAWELAPYDNDSMFNYARLLAQISQSDTTITTAEALTMTKEAVRIQPGNLNYRLQLAAFYTQLNDRKNALEQIDFILEVSPGYDQAQRIKEYLINHHSER